MELIHTQAAGDGGEIGFERVNGLRRRGLVAQVGLLHDILGIHRTPEHAVGDGKQIGTIGLEGFHPASSWGSTEASLTFVTTCPYGPAMFAGVRRYIRITGSESLQHPREIRLA